jgi:hypothetical protein
VDFSHSHISDKKADAHVQVRGFLSSGGKPNRHDAESNKKVDVRAPQKVTRKRVQMHLFCMRPFAATASHFKNAFSAFSTSARSYRTSKSWRQHYTTALDLVRMQNAFTLRC